MLAGHQTPATQTFVTRKIHCVCQDLDKSSFHPVCRRKGARIAGLEEEAREILTQHWCVSEKVNSWKWGLGVGLPTN